MKYTKDYYQILGVKPSARSAEIRRAYRRLAILYHPDRNLTPQSNAKMQEINEAYGVLGNHDKRAEYDFEHLDLIANSQTRNPHSFHQKETSSRSQRSFILGSLLLFSLFVFLIVIMRFLGDTAVFTAFLLAVTVIFLLIITFLAFWKLLKEDDASQCPQCKVAPAGEKMRDELVGIFRKSVPTLVQIRGGSNTRMVLHEKYKIHYRCKYCGHEWVIFQVKQIEGTPFV